MGTMLTGLIGMFILIIIITLFVISFIKDKTNPNNIKQKSNKFTLD